MRLLYIAPRDFPRRVANRVQTIKMAEALSRQAEVTLSVSKLHVERAELWNYYGVEHPFDVHESGVTPFGSQTLYSLIPALWQIKKLKPDVVLFREEYIGWFLSWFIKGYLFDMISFEPKFKRLYPRLVRRSRATFVISDGLKSAACAAGLSETKLVLARLGVDLAAFDSEVPPNDARKQLDLPLDKKLVLYSGRLSAWKGVDTLLRSAALLPEGVKVVFLGGFEGEPEALAASASSMGLLDRVMILGSKAHGDVPMYLKAADVLVLPNLPLSIEATSFTSPLKLFEYMAARRPIVASDLPAIREIVDDTSAALVPPGDTKALAAAIGRSLSGGPAIDARVEQAYRLAQRSSWDARASLMLAAFSEGNVS